MAISDIQYHAEDLAVTAEQLRQELIALEASFKTNKADIKQLTQTAPPNDADWGEDLSVDDQLIWYDPVSDQLAGRFVAMDGSIFSLRSGQAPGATRHLPFTAYRVTGFGSDDLFGFYLPRPAYIVLHVHRTITAKTSFTPSLNEIDSSTLVDEGDYFSCGLVTPANTIAPGVFQLIAKTYPSTVYAIVPTVDPVPAGWWAVSDMDDVYYSITGGTPNDIDPRVTWAEAIFV